MVDEGRGAGQSGGLGCNLTDLAEFCLGTRNDKSSSSKPAGSHQKKTKNRKKKKQRVLPAQSQDLVISATDPKKTSYAKVTRKLKSGVDLDSLGAKVTEIRWMKSGAMTLAVSRGENVVRAAEKLRVAIEAVLGADALRLHVLGISSDDDPIDIRDGLTLTRDEAGSRE